MKLALRRTAASNASRFARLAAWAIKVRLVSQYCHGGIAIGDTLYHATAHSGLCATEFEPENWDLFDLGSGNDQAVLALFAKHQGAAYDWFSLLAFMLPFKISDAQRFYCFEWAQLCISGRYPSDRVTPEDLLLAAMPPRP